jgi:outer membrane autotransporter protein
MTIDNLGSIGALNDRAITMGFPCATGENGPGVVLGPCAAGMPALQSLTVNNGGTVTGYVTLLGDAVHTFNNAGTFNMRNFAETTANGQRDTRGVESPNFGAGGGIFNNLASGVVQPLHVANPATINPTGQYIPTTGTDSRPLESSVYSMTQNPAITQSQFVNVATFNNAGTINLQNGVPGDVFVITGNPAAGGTPGTGVFVSNGGRLLVDATLNSGIPSGGQSNSIADVLVVDSTRVGAGGATQVFVNNVGGFGAQTTGNGIEIVEVRNKQPDMSAVGAFALGGRVAAGAFNYNLFQNGVGADVADGNWYLRSAGLRPEVPVDTVTPALAARLGLAMLGTATARNDGSFGEFCADDVETQPGVYVKARPPKVECNTLLWGRMFGATGSAGSGGNGNGGFGSAGPAYTFDYGGFQAGADLYRTARDKAGLYAGAATLQSNVMGVNGGLAGLVGLDAYGVGGYWTHRDPTGWYTDLVLQGNWYENIHAQSLAGQSFDPQGWGITASVETGYQVALGGGYSVIPQAQLVYQRTSIDGGTDQFGRISFGATDEIYGRLGARFAKDWLTNDGRTVTTWVDTNFWHQFGADAQTTFTNLQGLDPTTVSASLGGTWAQVGLGLSGQLTRNVSIFGRADYNISLDQPGHSLGARAGVKVTW